MFKPIRVKGFTLLELMVTVAVLAIVLMLAAPSFAEFTVSSNTIAVSSDLSADIGIARSQALQFGGPVTMCPSTDSATCGGIWADGWIILGADGALVRARTRIPDGFALTSGNVAGLVFSATGSLAAVTNWTLCKPGYEGRIIAISLAGRTTTQKTTCLP